MRRELLPPLPEKWIREHRHRISELERRGANAGAAAANSLIPPGTGAGDRAVFTSDHLNDAGFGECDFETKFVSGGSLSLEAGAGEIGILADGVYAFSLYVALVTDTTDFAVQMNPSASGTGPLIDGFFRPTAAILQPHTTGGSPETTAFASISITIGMVSGMAMLCWVPALGLSTQITDTYPDVNYIVGSAVRVA